MKILIGAAWPYASGPRHLGHLAGAFLPADVLARYWRLAGHEVLFVSGSDQYGTPITVAAERAGVPPARFAAEQHEAIARSLASAAISFDHYTATTSPAHTAAVHELFSAIRRRGFLTEGSDVGAWCPQHGRSLPDRYVEGGCPRCGAGGARGDQCDACGSTLDPVDLVSPHCRSCRGAVEFRPQRHLFLRLDAVGAALEQFLAGRAAAWRPWIAEEALGALRQGLRPRAITRDLDWGVTVPLDGWDDRRFYVWFDAVIGYLSATREAVGEAWRSWWADDGDVRHVYVVGKDNVWFHALWWPAILLAAGGGLRLPDLLVASHFLTEAGAQLSASRGHGTTVDEAIARAGVDPLRHALVALAPERSDASFSWPALEDLTRTGLLGAIVNPAHRVATLLWKRFGGRVAGPGDRAAAERALAAIGARYEAAELRAALRLVHELGREVNRRLAVTEPWREPDDERAAAALADVLPLVDAVAVAAWPVVPGAAGRILSTFGRPAAPASWTVPVAPATVLAPPQPPLGA